MLGSMETFYKQTCFSCREMCLQVRETAFDAHGRKHEFQPAECRQFAWEDGTVQKVDNVSRTVLQVYRFLKCRFFVSLLSFWFRICMFKVNPRGVQLPFLNRNFCPLSAHSPTPQNILQERGAVEHAASISSLATIQADCWMI